VTVRALGMSMATTLARTALLNPRTLRKSRSVDFRTDLESFEVVGHRPFPYQVDGDYLGEVDRLHFRHEPNALCLVLPVLEASGAAEHG
jgi:diacylglycerol kinase family enzyme